MKNSKLLLKLADQLSNKYAALDAEDYRQEIEKHIKTVLANASSQNDSNMMIPFITMAQNDSAKISFDVTRNDTLSFKSIKVSNFTVSPSQLTSKYQALPKQIEDYLSKNWQVFPAQRYEANLDYDNFTIHLDYDFSHQV